VDRPGIETIKPGMTIRRRWIIVYYRQFAAGLARHAHVDDATVATPHASVAAGNEPTFEAMTETAPSLKIGGESLKDAVFGLNKVTNTVAVDPATEIKTTSKPRMVGLSSSQRRLQRVLTTIAMAN
jgi:hypothetical protein